MANVQVKPSPNGRFAILAREDEKSPWVQIESVLGEAEAKRFAEDLEEDATERHAHIEANGEEEWEVGDQPIKE